MPQIMLVLDSSMEDLCTKEVFLELSSTLSRVVATTLNLEPSEVGVKLDIPKFTHNMLPLQVMVQASASPERLALMEKVREDINTAFLFLGMSTSVYMRNFIKAIGEVEVWPIMPPGSWESYRIAD